MVSDALDDCVGVGAPDELMVPVELRVAVPLKVSLEVVD